MLSRRPSERQRLHRVAAVETQPGPDAAIQPSESEGHLAPTPSDTATAGRNRVHLVALFSPAGFLLCPADADLSERRQWRVVEPVYGSIQHMSGVVTTIGKSDAALDQRLSDELDKFNAAATPDVAVAEELTVRIEEDGELVAGASGWTWGQAAGVGMTWVREDRRGRDIGARLLEAFEREAKDRGCRHVFVTSFTFQAPGFYQRLGYEEIFRWESVPTPGRDDVHMRKKL